MSSKLKLGRGRAFSVQRYYFEDGELIEQAEKLGEFYAVSPSADVSDMLYGAKYHWGP